MNILKATADDAEALTSITKKSKAHWDYSAEQIEAWHALLTISKSYINTNSVYKLVIGNKPVGYYSYYNEDASTVTLDNLFILPEYTGRGWGWLLMNDFLSRIKCSGIKKDTSGSRPTCRNVLYPIWVCENRANCNGC